MDQESLCKGCFSEKDDSGICTNCHFQENSSLEASIFLAPGTILAEKYLIGNVLGQGGFGITYLGWDKNLDIKLAIKEFFPQGLVSRTPGQGKVVSYTGSDINQFEFGLDRFLNEARTLAQFETHPNIVSIRDFFKANGTAYIIMSYVEGLTLEKYLLQKSGRLDFGKTLDIMMPVMDALKEVHTFGVMHRDISPDNILIDRMGRVIIIDFGAARQEVREKSKSLSVILKAGYAPEEQYRSRGKQGPWTDVYAVAATIYRSITGETPPESMDRLVEDEILYPSELGVEIDEKLEKVLFKGMEVHSKDRYQSMHEFQRDLIKGKMDDVITQKQSEIKRKEVISSNNLNVKGSFSKTESSNKRGAAKEKAIKLAPLIGGIFLFFTFLLGIYNFYPITELALNQENLELELGEKDLFLSASIKPFFIKSKPLIWESNNPNVVEIYSNGMIEVIDVGSAIITLKTEDESHQASCNVEVVYPTVVWNDGTYVGRLADDKPNGFGEWIHPSGESYSGNWENGTFNGEGTHILPDEQVFVGEFVNGLLQGEGSWSNVDGDTYIGEFVDGLKNGKGVYTWVDGSEFTGEFIEGLKHGVGVLISAEGKKTEGEWKDDEYVVRQVSNVKQTSQVQKYAGTLYNHTDSPHDYYIDGVFVVRLLGRQHHVLSLAAGYHNFVAFNMSGNLAGPERQMSIHGDGWGFSVIYD